MELVGKSVEVKKLELMLEYNLEHQKETEECTEEWYTREQRIQHLRTKYVVLTGRSYVPISERVQSIESIAVQPSVS